MAGYPFFRHDSSYPSDRELAWAEELQGVTHDDEFWYISQKDRLWKIPAEMDLDENISAGDDTPGFVTVPFPAGLSPQYNHMGDIDYYANYLFVSFEHTENNPVARLGVFNTSDLRFLGSDAVPLQGNKAPWAAVNPANGLLYSSRDDGVDHLFAYSFDVVGNHFSLTFDHQLALLRPNGAPLKLDGIQGAVFSEDNLLFMVSDDDDTRGVFVLQMPEGRQIQFIPIGSDLWSLGEELEGVTYWDLDSGSAPGIRGQLHVLELDNDYLEADDLRRFIHYRREEAKFVANKNPSCREVHLWDYIWVNRMSPSNKVPYDDLDEALDDGYDGCYYCLNEFNSR